MAVGMAAMANRPPRAPPPPRLLSVTADRAYHSPQHSHAQLSSTTFDAPLADDIMTRRSARMACSVRARTLPSRPDHPLPLTTPVQCEHTPADVRGRRCDVLSQMAMSCTIRAATRRSPRPKSPRPRARRSRHVHGKPALTQPGALCVSIRKSLSKPQKKSKYKEFLY